MAAAEKSQGLTSRLTAKAGPLPVWAWAVGIIVGGYLLYRLVGQGGTTAAGTTDVTSSPSAETAPVTDTGTSGVPAADQTVQPDVAALNDTLLSQLEGFGTQIDALTYAVATSPAFLPGVGDSAGSGAVVPNSGTYAPTATSPGQRATHPVQQPVVTSHTVHKPKTAAKPKHVAKTKPKAKPKPKPKPKAKR